MELKILGSTGGFSIDGRHTACYFIKDLNIFLDFGSGFFRAKEEVKNVEKVSILLSHLHHDHISGFFCMQLALGVEEVDIYVPKGEKDNLYRYLEPPYSPQSFRLMPFKVNLIEIEDEFEIETPKGKVSVKTESFEHPGGVKGFRIFDGDKTLVYMTDMRSAGETFEGAVKFARDADCLIHEANYLDKSKDIAIQTGHTTALESGELAKAANVKLLLLTHITAWGNQNEFEAEAKTVFENSHAAKEKETYII